MTLFEPLWMYRSTGTGWPTGHSAGTRPWIHPYAEPSPNVAVGVTVGEPPPPVGVGVAVAGVPVAVGFWQSWANVSMRPGERLAVLHEYCVKVVSPPQACTPTVAPAPLPSTFPYTVSNIPCPSWRRSSKCTVSAAHGWPVFRQLRHSMLSTRSGAVPVTDVNTPVPTPSV